MERRNPLLLPALTAALLLCANCRSITQTREEAGLPEHLVIFTFDDGPNPQGGTTARLLETLRKYEIRAAFALLGENAALCPDLVRRIWEEGHIIINHGYSDTWAVRLGHEEFRANLERGREAIEAALGRPLEMKLYRPQGGFYTKAQETIWREEGYTLVPGTVRAYDAALSAKDREKVLSRLRKRIERQGGGIIILHDGRDSLAAGGGHQQDPAFDRSWIPGAVEEIILDLTRRGYQLRGFDMPALIHPQ